MANEHPDACSEYLDGWLCEACATGLRAKLETAERDTEARIVAWLSRRASEGGPPGSLAWADEWWAVRDAIERGDHRKGADDGECGDHRRGADDGE